MRYRNWSAIAVLAILAPACKTWVKVPEHQISLLADNDVRKGGDFTFCVTLKDAASRQQIHAATYEYRITWVGLEGSTHKSKTGIHEKIRVKGALGTATLTILGYDANDNFGEVARHTFEVK